MYYGRHKSNVYYLLIFKTKITQERLDEMPRSLLSHPRSWVRIQSWTYSNIITLKESLSPIWVL